MGMGSGVNMDGAQQGTPGGATMLGAPAGPSALPTGTPPTGMAPATSLSTTSLTSGEASQVNTNGVGGTYLNGTLYSPIGIQSNGEDAGAGFQQQGIVGYVPGQSGANAQRSEFTSDGAYVRQGENMDGGAFRWSDFKDFGQMVAVIGSAMAAGVALAGAGAAGAAGGAAESTAGGFVGEGASSGIGAWDGAAGSGVGGGTAGGTGVVGGTGISTTPAGATNFGIVDDSVLYSPSPANYSVTSGPNLASANPDGTYLSSQSSGEGLVFNNSPNVASMGGGQGLTVQGGQTIGDPESFINAPENQLPGASDTTVAEGGSYTDYQPDLGDPNSPINGGDNPYPSVGDAPFNLNDWLKNLIGGGGGTGSVLGPALQAGTLLGSLLAPKPKTAPDFVPPQPEVGPSSYTSANAQGGASGSLQGVAGTLLTSKDTFGYGSSKTMLS